MPDPALTIASLVQDPNLTEASASSLRGGRYQLVPLDHQSDPVATLDQRREEFDALLLEQGTLTSTTQRALVERGLLLPAVVVMAEASDQVEFHDAEVHLNADQLEQLSYSFDAAVSRFLRRGMPASGMLTAVGSANPPDAWKLANRLKDRLGYLGVYYKRDPSRFLRNLQEDERQELLQSLTRTYSQLLISYFRDPTTTNQALENFVNTAFFSDLPITRTVEIHMNLIDGFWKQLELEGHKKDFLQDYRLTLLDVMAHLCEMYRRSIPADVPIPETAVQPLTLEIP